ncbi:hypothetical protein [Natronoglomus mannanivorans]|uniref:PLAT domain-containing protein n=1 Tax=Natronoglomus mannanivorans TaxID=2979990 RepID=A0AAP2YZ23_9EURY|nr:hypothetical protein [Halobacteria archaeon AArc-xg1-1]
MLRRNILRIVSAGLLVCVSGCLSNNDEDKDSSESENNSTLVPVDGPEEDGNGYEGVSRTASPSGISVRNDANDDLEVSLTVIYEPDDDVIFGNEMTIPAGERESIGRDKLTNQGRYSISIQTSDHEDSYEWTAGSAHSLEIRFTSDEIHFGESMP